VEAAERGWSSSSGVERRRSVMMFAKTAAEATAVEASDDDDIKYWQTASWASARKYSARHESNGSSNFFGNCLVSLKCESSSLTIETNLDKIGTAWSFGKNGRRRIMPGASSNCVFFHLSWINWSVVQQIKLW